MHSSLRGLLLCSALLLGPSVGSAERVGTIALTPFEMQATALEALRGGQSARALALAEALLLRDAEDRAALRIAAQAALNIEQSSVASERARALYRLSETDRDRYTAARLAALAEAQQDHYTRAQIWLRLARQAAPDSDAARAVARDYALVRQRNPLSIQVDLAFSPSNNINNGSSEQTFELLGFVHALSPDAQSLSGFETSAAVTLAYTLSESNRSRTQAFVTAQTVRYELSDSAQDQAPDFDASALDYDRLLLGLRHDWRVGGSGQPLTAQLNYGITHVGGDPYSKDIGFGLSSYWSVRQGSQITAGVRLAQVTYDGSNAQSESTAIDLGWNQRLGNGDTLKFATTLENVHSDDTSSLNSERRRLAVTYDFGRTLDYFDVSVGVSRQWRDYDPSILALEGRSDVRNDLTVAVGFPTVEYYGFSPVAEVEAQRTNSNVARFQSEGLSLDLSVRSNF